MSDISVKRAHGMEIDKAKQMLEQVSKDVKTSFPKLVNNVTWNDDQTVAKVKGKGFSGEFKVDQANISVDI
ncbi:MAG: polyhydroxyalkanoic acid system family protein, partial [Myxococcota bacterium]